MSSKREDLPAVECNVFKSFFVKGNFVFQSTLVYYIRFDIFFSDSTRDFKYKVII